MAQPSLGADMPNRIDEIAADMRARIEAGEWAPGEQLPTVTALAAHYRVARYTMNLALRDLYRDGLLYGVRGAGVFRSHDAGTGG
jgi:DNA-binding GntR family transcriptional regulator